MKVLAGEKKSGFISRFLTITFILVFILLVAVWFGARTDGGRDIAESKLSKHFGVDVSIESMRIGFPYVLVMENLRTLGFEAAGTAGFSVSEVELGRGFRYWNLHLKQLIVRVQDDGDGNWKPDSIARLGDLKNAEIIDMVHLTDSLRKKVRLRMVKSNMGWLDVDGVELATARDIDFKMLPVRIDDRRMHYYVLDIYNADGIALESGRDMHWEWLTTPKTDYIELPGSGENEGENEGENDECGTMNDEEWDEEDCDEGDEDEDAGGVLTTEITEDTEGV